MIVRLICDVCFQGFQFLMQMIRDVGNPTVSGPLILSVCRGNPGLGKKIIETIFDYLKRLKGEDVSCTRFLSWCANP